MARPASIPEIPFDFAVQFQALTDHRPYPWQEKLFGLLLSGAIPPNINLPTCSGKTSIMPIWLLALTQQHAANPHNIALPRRLIWVVNRRVVIDHATEVADEIGKRLSDSKRWASLEPVRALVSGISKTRDVEGSIAISTLRGEKQDNSEWSDDPSRPAIVIGTVDMIGSRLLFSGYGDGKCWRVQHAGLLGQDTLIVNDEAQLTPAFSSLLSAIEDQQKGTGVKPFRTIRLSAHSSAHGWPGSLEDDRANEHFRGVFEAKKRVQICDAGRQFSTLLELASEAGPSRTLIFVQQPEKVTEISQRLEKKLGPGAAGRILTLTGTMRGLERDQMIESPVFKAFAAPERPPGSFWLIATAAAEVGANISADRLITELDTLDHLLQRFGRLNRFGETAGEAYLLVSNAEKKDYRNKEALAFLRSLASSGEGAYNISPSALFRRELPANACSERPLEAPFHPWLIDVWSQTSLGSHPARPQVEPWLHGKQDTIAETCIAWRADAQYLSGNQFNDDQREEALEKYRLLAHEQLREPTTRLLQKIEQLSKRQPGDADILRRKPDGSVDTLKLRRFAHLQTDAQRRRAIEDIAYCQIVLPPGCGTLQNGMFSPDWVMSPSQESAYGSLSNYARDFSGYDVSSFQLTRKGDRLEYDEIRSAFRATQTDDGGWSLVRLAGLPGKAYAPEKCPTLNLPELQDFAMAHGWRLLLKLETEPAEGNPDSKPSALLYFARVRTKGQSAVALFMDKHLADVSARARALAECVGLPSEVVLALENAGRVHDLGKQDPIWQMAAGNLRPDGTYVKGAPVAKPINVMRDRDLAGFCHELASLRAAENNLADQSISSDLRDLVLHLIAAHHGHARPCFETQAYDRNYLKDSARIALESAQRFASVQQKYGAWGLAYLESMLRAADGIASRESAAEEQRINA